MTSSYHLLALSGAALFLASRKKNGKLNITLCESPGNVAENVPFRLATDAENVIRIKQSYPIVGDGNFSFNAHEWELPVAGVSHHPDSVMGFIKGESYREW